MALARGFSASRGSRVSFQLEILDAGRRVQPRGGRRRRRRWTAAAAGREERPHGVDGDPNAVQGWTVNELPSRVGWFLPIRLRLGGQDTLEEKYSGKEFIIKPPAELFFVA